ncbi:MAG: benzoate-CoA ligase family [Burkholderiaceae bacterium]|nr:benzoate-CoA ligase family [Burkholderiaceae bacterium]
MPAITINIAQQLLQPHIEARPEKAALILGDETRSYRQLWDYSQRFASLLQTKGIEPGARVAILLPDSFACYYVFFGCLLAGVVPVLVNPGVSRGDGEFILNDSQAVLLVTRPENETATSVDASRLLPIGDDASFEAMLAAHAASVAPHVPHESDIAFMLYTSGSTGKPKGVPHLHQHVAFTVETSGRQLLQMTEHDVVFSTSKLFFAYGFGNSLTMPLATGASVVLFPGRPGPEDILRILERHRPSVFFAVPTQYNLLLKVMEDASPFASLRMCISAGEGLPASVFAEWLSLTGLEIINGYGMSETLYLAIANPDGAQMPGSSGTLVPGHEARIVNDQGQSVPSGESGRLLLRSGSIAPFYWNRPDKTAETMLDGGWLDTGDIFIERDGHYYHQGRANDLFKVDAQWVAPALVENALRTHPAVRECVVAGRPVADMLRPWAFIVPADGIKQSGELLGEMRDHVSRQLPRHMVPVRFVFVHELPKTSTGKIQRFRL